MNKQSRTYLLLPLIPILWGFNVVAARVAMLEIHPAWGALLRFSLALLLFLLVLRRIPPVKPLPLFILLALTGVAGFNLLIFWGIRLATATDAAVISAVYPLTVALTHAFWFRQRLLPAVLAGMIVSGLGVVILTLGHATFSETGGWQRVLGDVLLIAAALSWGIYSTGMTVVSTLHPPFEATAGAILLGILLLIPVVWLSKLPLPEASSRAWLGLLYTAIGGSFTAFALWSHLLSKLPTPTVASVLNFTPVVALLASVFLLNEKLIRTDYAGMALIFGGVSWSQLAYLKKRN